MDQDFTLAVKAIIQAEEITRALSPSFSLIGEGVADARSLIMEQVTAEKIVAQIRAAALQTGKEVLRRLPSLQEATSSWLDQYQKGKLVVELDTTRPQPRDRQVQRGRAAAGGGGDRGRHPWWRSASSWRRCCSRART